MDHQTAFIIIAIIGVVCGIIMREVAKKRDSSQLTWFVVGLILGPVGLFFIPLIKKKKR